MNSPTASIPSVTELIRFMEKSVQDAAIALHHIRNHGMSGMNRLIRQMWPDLAKEIRTWVPERPWSFRLEMAVQVHTRTQGRFLRLLARIKNLLQKRRHGNGGITPVHLMLHTGKPSALARFLNDILWHDLFVVVQIEQTETGQYQTSRILYFNGRKYPIFNDKENRICL